MEKDDFIWGGTKEIADRPRGRKVTARAKCGSTQQKYGNTENILCFSVQAIGVVWLTVYTRSFISFPIHSASKGLCQSSVDNCSENYSVQSPCSLLLL